MCLPGHGEARIGLFDGDAGSAMMPWRWQLPEVCCRWGKSHDFCRALRVRVLTDVVHIVSRVGFDVVWCCVLTTVVHVRSHGNIFTCTYTFVRVVWASASERANESHLEHLFIFRLFVFFYLYQENYYLQRSIEQG